MKRRFHKLILLVFATMLFSGCKVEHDNDVSCDDDDCDAFCIENGATGGACDDDEVCQCDELENDSHDWTGVEVDTETGNDSDTST